MSPVFEMVVVNSTVPSIRMVIAAWDRWAKLVDQQTARDALRMLTVCSTGLAACGVARFSGGALAPATAIPVMLGVERQRWAAARNVGPFSLDQQGRCRFRRAGLEGAVLSEPVLSEPVLSPVAPAVWQRPVLWRPENRRRFGWWLGLRRL